VVLRKLLYLALHEHGGWTQGVGSQEMSADVNDSVTIKQKVRESNYRLSDH